MKRLIAAVILAAATCATAFDVPVRWPDGRIREGWPKSIGALQNPTPATCEAEGYALVGEAEVAAQEQADAAAQAQAEAEAAAQDSLPAVFPNGIAVLDDDGHHVELLPTGDGLPVIGAQVSNSPLTPEERAVMKAEREAMRAVLIAKSKDKTLNDKQKIALLMEAFFGVKE